MIAGAERSVSKMNNSVAIDKLVDIAVNGPRRQRCQCQQYNRTGKVAPRYRRVARRSCISAMGGGFFGVNQRFPQGARSRYSAALESSLSRAGPRVQSLHYDLGDCEGTGRNQARQCVVEHDPQPPMKFSVGPAYGPGLSDIEQAK